VVDAGLTVTLLKQSVDGDTFLVGDDDGTELGWVPEQNLKPLAAKEKPE
jgi:hypothetical protein